MLWYRFVIINKFAKTPSYKPWNQAIASHFLNFYGLWQYLVEEAKDLASNVLATSLFVIHNPCACREDDVTELTRREQLDNPLLEVTELNVVARADNTGLVQAVVL
jgi:hypothetical protein